MSDSEDIDPAEHALSMDELMTWLMKDLKAWCSSHGLAVSGGLTTGPLGPGPQAPELQGAPKFPTNIFFRT